VAPSPGLAACRLVDLPVIHDIRGNLTFVEAGRQVDFDVRRVYWLYDVPEGASRAGHAHRELEQLLIAASGSFVVTLDDGHTRSRVTLDRSNQGLIVPRLVWREIDDFSSGAVCLVLASAHYDESDYFRDYDEFLRAASAT
jgi:dTDP-4-dehydrorhamnose 3,5-epimerase-like enzyme